MDVYVLLITDNSDYDQEGHLQERVQVFHTPEKAWETLNALFEYRCRNKDKKKMIDEGLKQFQKLKEACLRLPVYEKGCGLITNSCYFVIRKRNVL